MLNSLLAKRRANKILSIIMSIMLATIGIFNFTFTSSEPIKAAASNQTLIICYDSHDDSTLNAKETAIQEAKPNILIDNTAYSLWGINGGIGGWANTIPSHYPGTEVYGYITGGYEGTKYGTSKDNLESNRARIEGIKSDGAAGVFLDEVWSLLGPDDPNDPYDPYGPYGGTVASHQAYIQAIYDKCKENSPNFKLILNVGVYEFDRWLYERCDYIMTNETYDGSRLPSDDEKYDEIHGVVGANVNPKVMIATQDSNLNATTASDRTKSAWSAGFTYHYSCADYRILPSWLGDYFSQIRSNEITSTIASGYDDGFSGSWGYNRDLAWYEAGNPGAAYNAWFRFTGITIPQGATITHAYLQTKQASFAIGTQLKISAEKNASPYAPTSTTDHENNNYHPRTTANVPWTEGFSDLAYHDSPDIAAVIQELVIAYDYSAGGNIQILVDNTGGTSSGEHTGNTFENGTPPKLKIVYHT